jgi:KTSC domain
MDWRTVTSSTIERVAYDSPSMTLSVEFKNGTIYQYFDVPETAFAELISAGSPGQYLAQNIKRSYRYSRG